MLNRAQRRFYEELAQKKRLAILRWQKEATILDEPCDSNNSPMFRRGTKTRRLALQQHLSYLLLKEYFDGPDSRQYRDRLGVEQAWLSMGSALAW